MDKKKLQHTMWGQKRIAKIPLTKETLQSLTNAASDVCHGRFAPKHIVAERLRICSSCPHGGTRCDLCGCFIKTKVSLLNSKCPIEKWSNPSRDTRIDSTQENSAGENSNDKV